jgi:hypothetical protein
MFLGLWFRRSCWCIIAEKNVAFQTQKTMRRNSCVRMKRPTDSIPLPPQAPSVPPRVALAETRSSPAHSVASSAWRQASASAEETDQSAFGQRQARLQARLGNGPYRSRANRLATRQFGWGGNVKHCIYWLYGRKGSSWKSILFRNVGNAIFLPGQNLRIWFFSHGETNVGWRSSAGNEEEFAASLDVPTRRPR